MWQSLKQLYDEEKALREALEAELLALRVRSVALEAWLPDRALQRVAASAARLGHWLMLLIWWSERRPAVCTGRGALGEGRRREGHSARRREGEGEEEVSQEAEILTGKTQST